ncbi:capsular biosynthesis protein [Oceanobacillus sp. 143]|uniref:Capsular biosynthesis protein n=1 Tax=Oceanobacillus zhaokaii TaxID=2052660 RepID=A0A345PKE5_9BACI|nr:Wzz/FepE/Etk N-terminal domain-containing protein [Oceanobacillus zhaokaii]AXI10475.1 capsular biosynthesis protein [Oceanobacillus zhaokaii]QGS69487.1 capsular biosynthesis protein [Oceanobacillus sp. 143]
MEETISLKEIFEVIKKRLLLISALTLGAAIIAAVISYFVITPTYEASSQFIVNQEQQDPNVQLNPGNIQTDLQLINTYNVIIKTPAILDKVIEELNLPYSAGALSSKIAVSSADNSQVVTVTATDEDPAQAVKIANSTVGIFQNEIPELMNVNNVNILTQAQLSPNPIPVAPNPILNIAIAIVLGIMVGIGLAFLLEYLDNSITTEDDVEKKLGLPVLGVISRVSDEDVQENQFAFQSKQMRRSGLDGAQRKTV